MFPQNRASKERESPLEGGCPQKSLSIVIVRPRAVVVWRFWRFELKGTIWTEKMRP